jgi:Secretion system C-terminal sorting domain
MRKKLLFSMGLSLLGWYAEAQTAYQSIFTPKTRWEVYQLDAQFNGSSKTQLTLKDTAMNNTTYQIFLEEGSAANKPVLMRESVTDKKVYAFEGGKEFLLYDFSLAVGDKFYVKQWEFEVVSIGTMATKEGERKTIDLKPLSFTWDYLTWVEGIGATVGPLYYKQYGKATESSQVTCFFRDTQLVYNVEDWKCELPVSAKEEILLARQVNIFPNPTDGIATIKVENPSNSDIEIRIFNIAGAMVMQKKYEQANEALVASLELQDMSKGMYFVVVKTNHGTIAKRLVKE